MASKTALKGTWSYLLGQLPLARQWALNVRPLPDPKAQGPVSAVYLLTAVACSGLSHLDKQGARKPVATSKGSCHTEGRPTGCLSHYHVLRCMEAQGDFREWPCASYPRLPWFQQQQCTLPLSSTGSPQRPGIFLLPSLKFLMTSKETNKGRVRSSNCRPEGLPLLPAQLSPSQRDGSFQFILIMILNLPPHTHRYRFSLCSFWFSNCWATKNHNELYSEPTKWF